MVRLKGNRGLDSRLRGKDGDREGEPGTEPPKLQRCLLQDIFAFAALLGLTGAAGFGVDDEATVGGESDVHGKGAPGVVEDAGEFEGRGF